MRLSMYVYHTVYPIASTIRFAILEYIFSQLSEIMFVQVFSGGHWKPVHDLDASDPPRN